MCCRVLSMLLFLFGMSSSGNKIKPTVLPSMRYLKRGVSYLFSMLRTCINFVLAGVLWLIC